MTDNLDWQAAALCREVDPELMFPEKWQSPRDAKRVCMACDVRATCLQWALDTDEQWGVYGGLTVRQRRALKRQAVAA